MHGDGAIRSEIIHFRNINFFIDDIKPIDISRSIRHEEFSSTYSIVFEDVFIRVKDIDGSIIYG